MPARTTEDELVAQLGFLGTPIFDRQAVEPEVISNETRQEDSTSSDWTLHDSQVDKETRGNDDKEIEDSALDDGSSNEMESSSRKAECWEKKPLRLYSANVMTILAAVVLVVTMGVVRTVTTSRLDSTSPDNTADLRRLQRPVLSQSVRMCPLDIRFGYSTFFETTETAHHCVEAPTLVGMKLIGGTCEENEIPNQPIQGFRCEDSNGGPPMPGTTTKIQIRATDNQGNVLYAGETRVGDVYYLYNNFEPLGAYTTVELSEIGSNSLLQTVTFDAGCSTPSFLGNVIGANQIVRFSNPTQSSISIEDAPQPTVSVSIADVTENVIMRELNIKTDFTNPRNFQYSALLNGVEIGPDPNLPTLQVSFESNKMIFPQDYTTTVSGSGEISGEQCVFEATDTYTLV